MRLCTVSWSAAGESSAYWLREGFGARLVGSPTAGPMLFGSLAPYVLPRSGLVLRLATSRFGYPDVEFTGLPVDASLPDSDEPGESLASRFHQLWG